jgi:hypothetical protein
MIAGAVAILPGQKEQEWNRGGKHEPATGKRLDDSQPSYHH